jgi:hypothetical protein
LILIIKSFSKFVELNMFEKVMVITCN